MGAYCGVGRSDPLSPAARRRAPLPRNEASLISPSEGSEEKGEEKIEDLKKEEEEAEEVDVEDSTDAEDGSSEVSEDREVKEAEEVAELTPETEWSPLLISSPMHYELASLHAGEDSDWLPHSVAEFEDPFDQETAFLSASIAGFVGAGEDFTQVSLCVVGLKHIYPLLRDEQLEHAVLDGLSWTTEQAQINARALVAVCPRWLVDFVLVEALLIAEVMTRSPRGNLSAEQLERCRVIAEAAGRTMEQVRQLRNTRLEEPHIPAQPWDFASLWRHACATCDVPIVVRGLARENGVRRCFPQVLEELVQRYADKEPGVSRAQDAPLEETWLVGQYASPSPPWGSPGRTPRPTPNPAAYFDMSDVEEVCPMAPVARAHSFLSDEYESERRWNLQVRQVEARNLVILHGSRTICFGYEGESIPTTTVDTMDDLRSAWIKGVEKLRVTLYGTRKAVMGVPLEWSNNQVAEACTLALGFFGLHSVALVREPKLALFRCGFHTGVVIEFDFVAKSYSVAPIVEGSIIWRSVKYGQLLTLNAHSTTCALPDAFAQFYPVVADSIVDSVNKCPKSVRARLLKAVLLTSSPTLSSLTVERLGLALQARVHHTVHVLSQSGGSLLAWRGASAFCADYRHYNAACITLETTAQRHT